MNRTIKEATANRYHYETHDQLRQHLADFVTAYNFGRWLKTLRGLAPYEANVGPGRQSLSASSQIRSIKARD